MNYLVPNPNDIKTIIDRLKILQDKEVTFINSKINKPTPPTRVNKQQVDSLEKALKKMLSGWLKIVEDPDNSYIWSDPPSRLNDMIGKGLLGLSYKIMISPSLDHNTRVIQKWLHEEIIPVVLENTKRTESGRRFLEDLKKRIQKLLNENKRLDNVEEDVRSSFAKVESLRVNLEKIMPKERNYFPKEINDLKTEILKLLFPHWGYFESENTWYGNDRKAIKNWLDIGIPEQLDEVIQGLEGIKYRLGLQSKDTLNTTLPLEPPKTISEKLSGVAETERQEENNIIPPISIEGLWKSKHLRLLRDIDSDPKRKGIAGDKNLLKHLKEYLTRRRKRKDIADTLFIEEGKIKTTMPYRNMFSEK